MRLREQILGETPSPHDGRPMLRTQPADAFPRRSPILGLRTRPISDSRGRAGFRLLTWAFGFFNSVRLLSYFPTLCAIHVQHDASQHSLLTWLTWAGANATLAAWLYEQNGCRLDRAIGINVGNAVMCLATVALILAYRL